MIYPFIEATAKVFFIQMNIDVDYQKPSLRKSFVITQDMVAAIDINSKTFNGNLLLIFPRETLLQVMSALMGKPILETGSETEEGAAELLNMIFGQAKIFLNEQGHDVKMALPSVKKSYCDQTVKVENVVIVPILSSVGSFSLGFTQGF